MATEKRLIYANDILLGIETFKKCYREHEPLIPLVKASIGALTMVAEFVNRTPTVDAVEVVHGRWIEILVPDGYVQKASKMRKKCSVCGWTNACRYHYCPNCGAKMDGGAYSNDGKTETR